MGKWGKSSNKKSIRKHGKAKENSGSRVIFPKFIFQNKNRYHRENLKQKLRVLQFCTLTLPSWLFLRKKLRYCINLIFYHPFFQNYCIIIAVLIFEKKHGSYRLNLCEKTENSVKKSDTMMIFSLNILQRRTQLQFWMKMVLSPQRGVFSNFLKNGKTWSKFSDFFIKKEFFFFKISRSKKLAHLILRCPAYEHCTA